MHSRNKKQPTTTVEYITTTTTAQHSYTNTHTDTYTTHPKTTKRAGPQGAPPWPK